MMLALLIFVMLFLTLVSLTPLLGYYDKKWVLPFMWGMFGFFTLVGWGVFLAIGWLNF
ncbi:MAG TPA: hypothetical protein IGS52_03535 [Oscillatoriaceae cyanobacterium M33_DOE_052]|uniref:hypothetical protein n=1 Tax=[Phormidium] sp. ETS-05 TaxID=222819 RepID=UPI0018EEF8A9|nr:hypothetical protein [[Phormidium] sp. ETS-05]HIK09335.1 hypothetical protein [Oscillatoriaceae cyanobacterium M33_DOE_052]